MRRLQVRPLRFNSNCFAAACEAGMGLQSPAVRDEDQDRNVEGISVLMRLNKDAILRQCFQDEGWKLR
jgi:hypothetical protein